MEETTLDLNDLKKFATEDLPKQWEFRGYVEFTLLELEDLMNSIIQNHFVKKERHDQFYGVVLHTIPFRHKVDIIQSVIEILEFDKTKPDFKKLGSRLHELFDFRNKITHKYPSVLDDMANSKKNNENITIKKYEHGQMSTDKITKKNKKRLDLKLNNLFQIYTFLPHICIIDGILQRVQR